MRTLLNRYLDTLGTGAGTKNANANFASATDFFIQPPSDRAFVIESLTVVVEDAGALLPEGYGVIAALGTGIGLVLAQPGEIDLLDGVLITRHYDWARLPLRVPPIDSSLVGITNNNQFIAQILFPEPLALNGKYNHSLRVKIPIVNLTGLVGHYFKAQGYEAAIS